MRSVQFTDVDVSITELRAHLAEWITRIRAGEEVVVTDRGTPVARLVPVSSASRIEQLTEAGLLAKPKRPKSIEASKIKRVRARGSVSDLIAEQRAERADGLLR